MDRGYIADRATVLPGRAIFTLPIERKKKNLHFGGSTVRGKENKQEPGLGDAGVLVYGRLPR